MSVKAVILAGGLGTRLRSMVNDRPKPLAPIGGVPFLTYLLQQVEAAGIETAVLCVGYKGEMIEETLGRAFSPRLRLEYVYERELLGTAGALKNAAPLLQDTFIAMNGDSYLEVDLRALLTRHQANKSLDPATIGTLALTTVRDATRFGSVHIDPGFRIRAFREKQLATGPGWVNGGIYVFEPHVLDYIPAGRPVSIEHETFPHLLKQGKHLYGFLARGYFMDIGTPEGYLLFQAWAQEQHALRGDEPPRSSMPQTQNG